MLVEVPLARDQLICYVLVDKIRCEAGPSFEETCMDGFEPCCPHGTEAGSMEVTDNLPLGCAVIYDVRGMAVDLLLRANILEFVNHEVLTGACWRRLSGECCGRLMCHRPTDSGLRVLLRILFPSRRKKTSVLVNSEVQSASQSRPMEMRDFDSI